MTLMVRASNLAPTLSTSDVVAGGSCVYLKAEGGGMDSNFLALPCWGGRQAFPCPIQ